MHFAIDTDNTTGNILISLEAVAYVGQMGADVMPNTLLHVDVMVVVAHKCVKIIGLEPQAELMSVGDA